MSRDALPKPPSPLQLRDELEDMVLKELLGPGSPDEEIIESPGTRYFVGVLAPRKKRGGWRVESGANNHALHPPPSTLHEDDDEEDADGEILDGDDLALGGRDTSQDGTTDQSAAQEQAKRLIPSSFGMTFSVNTEATEIDVSAAWGHYLREKSEYRVSEKTGNPRLVWKRYPRGGKHRLPLAEGPLAPIVVDANCPEIVVQGLVRRRSDHWTITLFLVNEQQEPEKLKDTAWAFQPELMAEGVGGAAVIHKRQTVLELTGTDATVKAENDLLAMIYRRHVEFAVGHGIGVHVDGSADPNHAVRVRTKVVPTYEVPKTTSPRPADAEINPAFAKLAGMVLDMKALAESHPKQFRPKFKPLVDAYRDWIEREEKRIADPAEGLAHFKHAAQQTIARCRTTLQRIEAGLDLLDTDDKAAQAFQFMNRAMWLQRTHSQFAERVRRGDDKPDMGAIDIPDNRSWYPFQLAFVLLNLPGITKFDHPERSESPTAVADLLWFPTGGGKTEAYLGLTAYTLGLRRLQGVIEGRSGENGVAVLMRYTLRLLTLQQFQRAAALICACEDSRPLDYAAYELKPLNVSDGLRWNCSFDPRTESVDLLLSVGGSPVFTEVKMAGDKFVSAAVVQLLYYASILANDGQRTRLAREIKGFTAQEAWLCVIAQRRDEGGFADDLEAAVSFLRHEETRKALAPFFSGAAVLIIEEIPEPFCTTKGVPSFRVLSNGEHSIEWRR